MCCTFGQCTHLILFSINKKYISIRCCNKAMAHDIKDHLVEIKCLRLKVREMNKWVKGKYLVRGPVSKLGSPVRVKGLRRNQS